MLILSGYIIAGALILFLGYRSYQRKVALKSKEKANAPFIKSYGTSRPREVTPFKAEGEIAIIKPSTPKRKAYNFNIQKTFDAVNKNRKEIELTR